MLKDNEGYRNKKFKVCFSLGYKESFMIYQ